MSHSTSLPSSFYEVYEVLRRMTEISMRSAASVEALKARVDVLEAQVAASASNPGGPGGGGNLLGEGLRPLNDTVFESLVQNGPLMHELDGSLVITGDLLLMGKAYVLR